MGLTVKEMEIENTETPTEKPDAFWRKVYVSVVITTVVVVTLLWAFSRYFSG